MENPTTKRHRMHSGRPCAEVRSLWTATYLRTTSAGSFAPPLKKTLNGLLEAEADRICSAERVDSRSGRYERTKRPFRVRIPALPADVSHRTLWKPQVPSRAPCVLQVIPQRIPIPLSKSPPRRSTMSRASARVRVGSSVRYSITSGSDQRHNNSSASSATRYLKRRRGVSSSGNVPIGSLLILQDPPFRERHADTPGNVLL
jgi:hypothetical protein